MATEHKKLTPENVARLASQMFAMEVRKITAPGGKARESLRIHFPTKTIVATQRKFPGRMRLEAEVLRRLTSQGAPVPRFMGGNEQIFFQEDVGSRRLSGELAAAEGAQQLRVARRAMESLQNIHEAGRRAKLAEIVPALGEEVDWVRGLVGTVVATSAKYGLPAPDLDLEGLVERLHVPADTFLKWDARPGNASLGAEGQVYWFDWEHAGKRQGMEDFAWMMGDEFWPLSAEDVLPVLQDILPPERVDEDLDYLSHFISFHIIQRLAIIHRRFERGGWVDAAEALRYDKIGVDPALVIRLAQHGAAWAGRAPLTRPLVGWFGDVARIVPELKRKSGETKGNKA